jgi:hypothetical protein
VEDLNKKFEDAKEHLGIARLIIYDIIKELDLLKKKV